jgi:hypothetical protein
MADKSTPLILDALGRAATEPAGVPLHGAKGAPGLFATSATAKQLAKRCKDEGLLQVIRTETRGKTVHEICALSEQGLAFLLKEASPRQVVEDLVRALEARRGQIAELAATAQLMQASLESLKAIAAKILDHLRQPTATTRTPATNGTAAQHGSDAWLTPVLTHLRTWRGSGALEDCPLPELYQLARQSAPALSIGHFHDGIRRLHAQHQLYLHPWTGPLYELPEPALALLSGHEIAYYASLR